MLQKIITGQSGEKRATTKSECQDQGLAAAEQAKQKRGPNSIEKWHRGCGR